MRLYGPCSMFSLHMTGRRKIHLPLLVPIRCQLYRLCCSLQKKRHMFVQLSQATHNHAQTNTNGREEKTTLILPHYEADTYSEAPAMFFWGSPVLEKYVFKMNSVFPLALAKGWGLSSHPTALPVPWWRSWHKRINVCTCWHVTNWLWPGDTPKQIHHHLLRYTLRPDLPSTFTSRWHCMKCAPNKVMSTPLSGYDCISKGVPKSWDLSHDFHMVWATWTLFVFVCQCFNYELNFYTKLTCNSCVNHVELTLWLTLKLFQVLSLLVNWTSW